MREKNLLHLIRANVAGAEAVAIRGAAETLFETGGKRLLAEGAQKAIRELAENSAKAILGSFAPTALARALGAAELTTATVQSAATELAKGAGKAVVRETGKAAMKEVLKGAGKAAGVGFVVDGVFGGVEAALAYKKGTMTGKEAAVHISTEAGTGALATGAGVAVAAGIVALTGGLAAPVVFVIGAGSAIGAKQGLKHLLSRVRPAESA
ncbi:MAG: hypothetical protein HUU21_17595 [Polyangiaceae bacterium]|nr:hypothetical protein [Polyangiaceae bacterium]